MNSNRARSVGIVSLKLPKKEAVTIGELVTGFKSYAESAKREARYLRRRISVRAISEDTATKATHLPEMRQFKRLLKHGTGGRTMKTPDEIKKALRICSGKLLDYCDAS